MSISPEEFFNELKAEVEADRLVLPSLPEVALKIRDVVENENTTIEEIVNILSQDGAMTARLLKVVNSPLYPSRMPIDDIHLAVTRLGMRLVRDLVMNLAMRQMYQPTSASMERQFRKAWSTSVDVASIAQMMSVSVIQGIRKERALLAGLIHNIGLLPILLKAENDDALFQDEVALNALIQKLQGPVGAMILQNWNFPVDLIDVVKESHNFNYDHEGAANLVDLIQFTLLQGGFIVDEHEPEDWSLVPSFAKMGVDVEVNVIEDEENQEIIEDARQSLMF